MGKRRKVITEEEIEGPVDENSSTERHHPLFPAEPSKPIPEIVAIGIVRVRSDGTRFDYPTRLLPEAIQSQAALEGMVGGGKYELTGYNSLNHFTARRWVNFEGEPLPFPNAVSKAPTPAAPVEPPAPAPRSTPPMSENALFLQMMVDDRRMALERMQQQANATTTLITSLVGAAVPLITAWMTRPAAAPAASADMTAMLQAVTLGSQLKSGVVPGAEAGEDTLADTLIAAAEALKAFKNVSAPVETVVNATNGAAS